MKFKEKFPELNNNQVKQLKREILAIIGEDEEVPSMEEYTEWRGGILNIEDDDNPEIAAIERNELKQQLRNEITDYFNDKLGTSNI